MFNKLFHSLLVIILTVSITYSANAQVAQIPINTSEKFNERGFMSSNGGVYDNNEIIGDYDGNLSLVYNTHYELPNDMSYDLMLSYNANVFHKTYKQFAGDPGGFGINRPTWILGMKQFALMTTNFEVNWYFTGTGNELKTGETVPTLIPGYHYTNRQLGFRNSNNPNNPTNDFIEILKADGSVLSLYNYAMYAKIGQYIETNSDGIGYAIVEMRTDATNLRKMWYKPGDGLTYYFEEEMVKYNGRDYNADEPLLNPRVMYLKEIISGAGDKLIITYYSWNELSSYFPEGFGRQIIKSIFINRRVVNTLSSQTNSRLTEFDYSWNGSPGNYEMGLDVKHEFNNTKWTIHFKTGTGSPIFTTSQCGSNHCTKIKYIIAVQDDAGRYNRIYYNEYYRKYSNGGLIHPIFKYEIPAYLPFKIEYHNGKKTEIVYKQPSPSLEYYEFSFNTSGNGCDIPINLSNINILNSTYRDDFTNYMIAERNVYDSYPSEHMVYKEKYTYLWGTGNQYNYQPCVQANNILTKIEKIKYSGDNSAPTTVTTIKNFTKYIKTYKPNAADLDDLSAGVIRMISETMENESGKKVIQLNTWDATNDYHLASSEEQIIDAGNGSSRKTNIAYESMSHIVSNKKFITKKIITNPLGIVTEQSFFTTFLPNSNSDITAFYKTNVVESEKVYKNLNHITTTKSFDTYRYFTSGEKIGKLHEIIKNSHSRSTRLTNDYYTKVEDPSYYGLLKSQVSSFGTTTYYYYPSFILKFVNNDYYYIVEDVTQGYLVANDGTKTLKDFTATHYSTKPFKTKIHNSNNSNVLQTNTSFDTRGNLLFEIDVNRNYSEYDIDIDGRVTRAKFPGCFFPDGQIMTDITYLKKNYDLSASSQFTINSYHQIGQTERYAKYAPTEAHIDPGVDSNVGKDAESDGLDEDASGTNPNYDFYIFFPEEICLTNVVQTFYATLKIRTTDHTVIGSSDLSFKVYGITQNYSNGTVTYQTVGEKIAIFQDQTLMSIDVSDIVQSCKNTGANLYGFKISALGYFAGASSTRRFNFSDQIIPTFISSFKIMNTELSNARSSIQISYDDENNKVDIIKRFSNDPQSESTLHSILKYNSLKELLKTDIQNSSGNYDTKKEIIYNYLGLVSNEKDGEGRKLLYTYDKHLRVDKIYAESIDPLKIKQTFEYTPIADANQYMIKSIKDGENKTTNIYYLKDDQIDYEEKSFNGDYLYTDYEYDAISRLTSVISPEGKTTSYLYDDHSNISQKISPDEEGTVKFKYDRYDHFRFSISTSKPTALVFNKYDSFNRLILTGEKTIASNEFDLLDPDLDYSITHGSIGAFENYTSNQSNFVVVNMYDDYTRTGIFSNLTNFASGVLENLKGKLVATAFRDGIGGTWSYKVYSYDNMGRVKDEYVYFQSTSVYKKISNEYDNLGNLIKQNVDAQYYYWYSYDEQGRLKEVRSSLNSTLPTAKLEAVYTYDKSDKVLTSGFGTYGSYAPRMLYTYDNQGRVNDINGIAYDVFTTAFHQTLTYYKNDNLYTMYLKNDGDGTWPVLNFTYTYDDINRLTSSNCSNSYYTETYEYYDDGNLYKKSRPNNSSLSQTYTYLQGTNKLSGLTKGTNNYSFSYDYRGNMITDSRKPITSTYPIVYDRRNLPLSVKISSSTNTYSYDDAGQRIYKQLSSTNKEFYLRDHTGKELAVYNWYTGKQKMFNIYGNGLIGKANITYDASNNRTASRQYYLKDHLGSIRMTIDGASFDVVGAQDYYPYGALMEYRSFTTGGNINDKYKFTEKERDVETNYDYFGARLYDSDLGRWLQLDPLADKYPGWSPYNYCVNNPLGVIDPEGKEIWIQYWTFDDNAYGTLQEEYQYKNGKLYDSKGNLYKGKNKYILNVLKKLNNLVALGNKEVTKVLNELEKNGFHNTIHNYPAGNSRVNPIDRKKANSGGKTAGDMLFQDDGFPDVDKCDWSYEAVLGHELRHLYDFNLGYMKGYFNDKEYVNVENRPHEVRAVKFENIIRNEQGLKRLRTTYHGRKIDFSKDKIRK